MHLVSLFMVLKSNLHPNTVISLNSESNESKYTKGFATIKLYSKCSALFRDGKEFPGQLEFSLPTITTENDESNGTTQVIISKLLAVNLNVCEVSGNLNDLKLPIQLRFEERVMIII